VTTFHPIPLPNVLHARYTLNPHIGIETRSHVPAVYTINGQYFEQCCPICHLSESGSFILAVRNRIFGKKRMQINLCECIGCGLPFYTLIVPDLKSLIKE